MNYSRSKQFDTLFLVCCCGKYVEKLSFLKIKAESSLIFSSLTKSILSFNKQDRSILPGEVVILQLTRATRPKIWPPVIIQYNCVGQQHILDKGTE